VCCVDARASMGLAAAEVVDLTANDEVGMLPSALVGGDSSQQQHTKPSCRRRPVPPAAWQPQQNKREQPRLPAKRKAPRTHAATDVKPSQQAAVPPAGQRAAAAPLRHRNSATSASASAAGASGHSGLLLAAIVHRPVHSSYMCTSECNTFSEPASLMRSMLCGQRQHPCQR